ncbi:MAG TPA: o-succinylbenzoate synthase [bacterium (Candidatus Stahlbacteria)]|nr:o-succinylbenzoate synthase [Candidatus Stahlbacteria bacterium]
MIELRILQLPLKKPFETSGWQEQNREFILIKVSDGEFAGYGEVVALKDPYYSSETTKTGWHILEDYLIPLAQAEMDPHQFHLKIENIRGHQMAKAGLEGALFDLKARREKKPLFKYYGGDGGRIEVGVSVGIKKTVGELIDEIAGFLDEGYVRVKIKIKKGWDIKVLESLRREFPKIKLWADANGGYTADDTEYLKGLDGFDLELLEQPFPPDDLVSHAQLRKEMKTRVCLDESVTSIERLKSAVALGAIDILNLKVGRVGGVIEALKILEICKEHKIPVWVGGMLETGVGRGHNLHLASNPAFSLTPDLSASDRYYEEDICEPPFLLKEGMLSVPDGSGIGVAVREDLVDRFTVHKRVF